MPAVFFTNLALLSGLAALAVPVLIHLLLKRKKQRLRFSTLQFFVKQDEQASKRRKLRHWLLLAVRLLLVTLLVTSFARPFTRTILSTTSPGKRIGIFVLDRSMSMQAAVRGATAWNRSLNLARTTLREFKADEQAALVTCAAHTEVLSGLKPAPVVARLLDGLRPEFTSSELAEGLRAAVKLASVRDENTAATIYIVSDLQKSSSRDLQTVSLPADIEVKVLNGAELYASNIAIEELRLEGQVQPQAEITLKSFSDEDQAAMKLSLVVDGKEVVNRSLTLKAGAATNMVIGLPALKPGWHSAEARLAANDALQADDTRYHTFFIAEPLRVLCVETKTSARIHEQDAFFVASALRPDAEPGTSVPALFSVEFSDPLSLVRHLAPAQGLSSYAAVILPALRQIPEQAAEALSTYVRNGGGLLLFVGDGMSANRYNVEFRDLLPLQLVAVDARANAGWHLETFEKNSPIFACFRGAAAANLRLPEFTRRFRVSPMASAAGASTLAIFDDALPLVASRSVGAGRVLLVNTSADASWSDWPKRKSFVPWLHGAVNSLGGRSSQEMMQPSRLSTAGEDVTIALGKKWKGQSLVIQRGDAKGESVMADEEGRLANLNVATPGVYVVRALNGVELQRWAVNLPARESELTALPPQELQKQLVHTKESRPANLPASLFGEAKGEKEWWRVLLLAALCLLFAEVFLANRTRA
jgi:hypothetical protein